MPPAFFTSKRVSSRMIDVGSPFVSCRLKCLIHTVPVGNVQLALELKVMVEPRLGTENQRVLIALSDQNGRLMSYGTMPAAAASASLGLVSEARLVKAPVSASVGGMGAPFVTLL